MERTRKIQERASIRSMPSRHPNDLQRVLDSLKELGVLMAHSEEAGPITKKGGRNNYKYCSLSIQQLAFRGYDGWVFSLDERKMS
jgi:hypothetical protein